MAEWWEPIYNYLQAPYAAREAAGQVVTPGPIDTGGIYQALQAPYEARQGRLAVAAGPSMASPAIDGSSSLTSRPVKLVAIDATTGNPIMGSASLSASPGVMRTTGQAGNVGLPPSVVPASVQRMLGELSAEGAPGRPISPPGYAVVSAPRSASGSVATGKDMSQIGASSPLLAFNGDQATGLPSSAALRAINTNAPTSLLRLDRPFAQNALRTPIAGMATTGAVRRPAPIMAASAPAAAPPAAPAIPAPPVGASFLQAQGQNTAGMTDGQVANNLAKAMGTWW